jgi:SpoVK/Ycf46/Vps4 family AAA+-type ATPase
VALFTGPPGTGKTMAAQVIARGLGLDLYRVDLSTVVSKYVGETAANIERILSEASATDVVLLFDEADGLFARRTDVSDAHDRYANTDTGHLLQAIERYDGIVLLASNRKRNIDDAFARRLRYVLEFPLPDDGARLAIWQQVVGELAGPAVVATLQPTLARIASRLVMTGAQIKHAALTAIFHAERAGEPLGRSHVLRGVDAELMKEGRALSERELKQLEGEP